MPDEEFIRHFDGSGRVELLPGRISASHKLRIEEIAHALGYRLLAADNLGRRAGIRLRFERDDSPNARRRAEQTIERLRAGGSALSKIQEARPTPPPPPPMVVPSPQPRQRYQQPQEPPPPPSAVAPARPRFPLPAPIPPPPPPPSLTQSSYPGD